MKKLLIIGAGGHGKVVADTAVEAGHWHDIYFLDDNIKNFPYKIIGKINQLPNFVTQFPEIIVAIGDNKRREELLLLSKNLGYDIATVIHPTACVSTHAIVEKGSVVLAKSVINAFSKIGFGCIINTGAVVDHDCTLDHYVHISPNATLAGGVIINKYSWIGAGSTIIEKINIGYNVIIGAGTVVIHDVSDDVVAVGVPAKIIKQNKN
jgi:sugar O-acyltransferase (sialic acid O-acetyltransferase NeuD family)